MKKIIIAALTAIMALSVFTGCSYKAAEFTDVKAEDAVVDITAAVKGYGLEVTVAEDKKSVTFEAAGYSQASIALPVQGYPKAEIDISTTGKTTIGFLKAGAAAWDGRIADADAYYDDPLAQGKITVDVPADAAFITFGSNGEDSTIIVKSITLKAE